MDEDATWRAYLVAATGGLALWSATALVGGRAEPWDTGLYWSLSYPVALGAAVVLGYVFPIRPWRWAIVLIYSQAVVMLGLGSGLGLLPLGLVLLAFLCLPAVALAGAGKLARRWVG
jgi:hypothetical protein